MGGKRSMQSLSKGTLRNGSLALFVFTVAGCATPTSSIASFFFSAGTITAEKNTPPPSVSNVSSAQSSAVEVQSSLDPISPSPKIPSTTKPTQPPIAELLKPEAKTSAMDSPPSALPNTVLPDKLSIEAVVVRTLVENPQLAAIRQQRLVANAGVVIAKTYPFNPIWQSYVWSANGPRSADIKNPVFNEHTMRLDLELRGQGKHRRAAANAAVTRTEWEIATQEIAVAILSIRSFWTQLYREEKLKVLDETIRLNEETVKQVNRLVELGRAKTSDLVLMRTEVDAARAMRGQGTSALAVAKSDLRRNLGSLDQDVPIRGSLEIPIPENNDESFEKIALRTRPDLHARRMSVTEAEAMLNLEIANRFGNPSLGPSMEFDDTRTWFAGLWLVTPIPVFNTRKGDVLLREAARNRAIFDARQIEIQAQQDVKAALNRLDEARKWARIYQDEVLPNLKKSREDLDKLFNQGDASVDVLRLIDVQRKLLQSQDRYLDARFEVLQALADLAAAVGDPSIAMGFLPKKDNACEVPGNPVQP
jgi:outer membrane protein TolC